MDGQSRNVAARPAKLAINPIVTGSPPATITMGIVVVAS